ncbi:MULTISPECIES: lipase family protein [Rhodococcus]|jgi:hypothetical protein|uniref:lipase family protein n=1 Tax=Rhodococcus TaxID=1827 RepID=UPI00211BB400|nr:lipase family protein [Rhodococcus sp. ACS1]
MIAYLLSRGWAVVTADYEGPESEFLAGPQAGYAVLDGIRAALQFGPSGLSPHVPSHNTTLVSGAPGAIDFLAARFAGRAAVDDCV